MRKLNTFAIIAVLLISTINSPVLFSSIALSEEQQQQTGTQTQTTTTTQQTQTTATPPSTETAPTTTESPKTETTQPATTEVPPSTEVKETTVSACPAPPQSPVCGENQGLVTNFDDRGCVSGYECKEIAKTEVGKVAACPEVPLPTITCDPGDQLTKTADQNGCVNSYYCASTRPESTETTCPSPPEKPACDGSVSPIFDKGCLISYTCVPQGCRQETDHSGFVRVVCKQEKICQADKQQKELIDNCKLQGGNPIPFQDPNGCTFYDCRFDERGHNTNPLSGHQSCSSPEEIHEEGRLCKEAGLNPRISFEGGCKIVKCSQEREDACRFVSESDRFRIENECSSRGYSVVRDIDKNGCAFYRCEGAVGAQTCQRDIPPEAYSKCDSKGGEMIVKNDRNGCVVFSECVAQGDENDAYSDPVEEVPDATVLLSLALKLEQLKIELQKLATESGEISKYYASVDSLDEERYNRVSTMFEDAAGRVDEIKTKIRDNVDDLTTDDLEEIKHDIKYIKEVTLKDILYLMLSNSDDVKETLEHSKKVSGKKLSSEELERNVKSCGTDGSCFDRAIRSCKPVSFQPEGRNGPSLTIKGLEDDKCVLHVIMQSDGMVPPGFTRDNFYMDCPIPDYTLGVRGPEDIIPNCEGPMAKFAKQFGGAAEISGGGDEFQDIIEKEGGPGGCTSERECATYCLDNYDECKEWIKDHPAVGPIPSREELRRYASGEEIELREEFREQRKSASGFSGPGGCQGPQECDKFCRNNPDECLRWCEENPDICPKERGGVPKESIQQPSSTRGVRIEQSRPSSTGGFEQPQGGFGQPSGGKCPDGICDQFERDNPDACPQDCGVIRQTQPSSVQACVGCLNNGVCDIGECSECVDCLKGERSITGEISRVR